MIRLSERVNPTRRNFDGDPKREFYVLVPGEEGHEGTVTEWSGHQASVADLEHLRRDVNDLLDDQPHPGDVDYGIDQTLVETAVHYGAHQDYVDYITAYPADGFADGLRRAVSMDAMDDFKNFASEAEYTLFDKGIEGSSILDSYRVERAVALFGEERVPEVLLPDE